MRQSVRDYWATFNKPFEGRLTFMYLDVKGLVSTGVGNLIDRTKKPLTAPTPTERAASLRAAGELTWLTADGSVATPEQVAEEWDRVKVRMDLAPLGGGHFAPPVTTLHITQEEIDRFVEVKREDFARTLTARPEFSDFENWPADAQLGLLSMAWGMGPAFDFPKFQAFAAAGDFAGAATECRFNPEKGTIVKRNDADQQCFRNAAQVVTDGLDPNVLIIAGGAPTPAPQPAPVDPIPVPPDPIPDPDPDPEPEPAP